MHCKASSLVLLMTIAICQLTLTSTCFAFNCTTNLEYSERGIDLGLDIDIDGSSVVDVQVQPGGPVHVDASNPNSDNIPSAATTSASHRFNPTFFSPSSSFTGVPSSSIRPKPSPIPSPEFLLSRSSSTSSVLIPTQLLLSGHTTKSTITLAGSTGFVTDFSGAYTGPSPVATFSVDSKVLNSGSTLHSSLPPSGTNSGIIVGGAAATFSGVQTLGDPGEINTAAGNPFTPTSLVNSSMTLRGNIHFWVYVVFGFFYQWSLIFQTLF